MNGQTARQVQRVVQGRRERDRPEARIAPGRLSRVLILDPELCEDWLRERQARGIDKYDEVWDGTYLVPPLVNNAHQDLVGVLSNILFNVVQLEGRGRVQLGANVSDRRKGWEQNFRAPDVVVVLEGGRAVDCNTHWFGGPDFLIEVQSPGDDREEKIPFYSKIQVRELLIVHRDTRQLQLYRHDGNQLASVQPTASEGAKWLLSDVVPLAFRRKADRRRSVTEVRRTDGTPGNWTV